MAEESRPIFHDPAGNRWRFFARIGVVVGVYTSIVGVLVCLTVLLLPATNAVPTYQKQQLKAFLLRHTQQKAKDKAHEPVKQIKTIAENKRNERLKHLQERDKKPLSEVYGFYANWDANSYDSLWQHIDGITYIVPTWLKLNGNDKPHVMADELNPQAVDLHDQDVLTLSTTLSTKLPGCRSCR